MMSADALKKQKGGRPATGRDLVSAIRLSAELTLAIDSWAARNNAASRSEAIRQLVEMGLAGVQPTDRRRAKIAPRASDMAAGGSTESEVRWQARKSDKTENGVC
jgi:hypothetical protein